MTIDNTNRGAKGEPAHTSVDVDSTVTDVNNLVVLNDAGRTTVEAVNRSRAGVFLAAVGAVANWSIHEVLADGTQADTPLATGSLSAGASEWIYEGAVDGPYLAVELDTDGHRLHITLKA